MPFVIVCKLAGCSGRSGRCRARWMRALLLASAFLPVILALACSADAAAPPAGFKNKPGKSALVLRNGRLVEGRISQSSGGYVVERPNGRLVVPFSQVEFQARSGVDAYRKLREQIPPKSVKARLALAGWCVTNQLLGQARKEVRIVLTKHPGHKTAERMLRRIDALLDADTDDTQKQTSIYERMTAPEVTALSGLSPEVARKFVGTVQPLLMNSCATAGCHGPRAQNGFRLSIVHLRSGNRRGGAEQNLSAVLRYVDLEHPDKSPLLTKPRGNHGRKGRAVFRGRSGVRQVAKLRRWVRSVAAESNRGAPIKAKSQTPRDRSRSVSNTGPTNRPLRVRRDANNRTTNVQPSQFRSGEFGVRNPLPAFQPTPAMRAMRSRFGKQRHGSFGRSGKPAIRNDDRNAPRPRRSGNRTSTRSVNANRGGADDPFDPEVFNRRSEQYQSQRNQSQRNPSKPERGRFP